MEICFQQDLTRRMFLLPGFSESQSSSMFEPFLWGGDTRRCDALHGKSLVSHRPRELCPGTLTPPRPTMIGSYHQWCSILTIIDTCTNDNSHENLKDQAPCFSMFSAYSEHQTNMNGLSVLARYRTFSDLKAPRRLPADEVMIQ